MRFYLFLYLKWKLDTVSPQPFSNLCNRPKNVCSWVVHTLSRGTSLKRVSYKKRSSWKVGKWRWGGAHSAPQDLELQGVLVAANRDATYTDSFLSTVSKINCTINMKKKNIKVNISINFHIVHCVNIPDLMLTQTNIS